MRSKLYINDNSFAHAKSTSLNNVPENFDWVRGLDHESNDIFITDPPLVDKYIGKRVYGWLIEPPDLIPHYYDFTIKNHQKFEKIFTYSKDLLSVSDKFEFLPIGGCWIDPEDRQIHDKSGDRVVCTVASNKRMTKAHRFRHEVISAVKNIDVYGLGYRRINKKIDVLRDYMFCIVMENQVMDYLFTEKLIDCLVTGTIPIYYGCPSIGDFFDTEGFLTFNTIEELSDIIPKLDKEFYDSKIEHIKNNFELAKKYVVADDIIYEKMVEWEK